MLFTTFSFAIFLPVVLLLFYILPRPARSYLLLAASLFFYMAWRAKFVVLILGLITVDYFAALWISRRQGAQRRMALMLSLAANVGMLGWFKYANFARETWLHLLYPHATVTPLDIILPLGISFHTFQSISYVIDVYRGEQEVVTSYVDYALFVAFFPQLVAGPIVRAREFFHDFWNWRAPTGAEWQQGVATILTGFVKKLVFADQFSLVADQYFTNPAALPGLLPAWTGTIAFALQIFFDFSGYTDIAIGVALLFGFHFPENFRQAISFGEHHRVLAPLAYDAFALAARLHIYIVGRQPARRTADVSQPVTDDAARRLVARGELEFCDLGRISRRTARH